MIRLFSMLVVCASMLLAGCSKNGGGDDGPKTITVISSGNGEASADKLSAAEGETVKLTATADPGYSFDKWTVESGGVTCSPDASANPATFTMPAGNVSIKAEFIEGVRINGVVWAYTNVDAPGTFAAKPEDAGMYYQWNRRVGWSSTDPLTSSPAGATWDSTTTDGESWTAANDPCPAGWRVPTTDEFSALCDAEKTTITKESLNDVTGQKFTDKVSGNSVFFPVPGFRENVAGALKSIGSNSYYWSATPVSGSGAFALIVTSDMVTSQFSCRKSYGISVRCVAK